MCLILYISLFLQALDPHMLLLLNYGYFNTVHTVHLHNEAGSRKSRKAALRPIQHTKSRLEKFKRLNVIHKARRQLSNVCCLWNHMCPLCP